MGRSHISYLSHLAFLLLLRNITAWSPSTTTTTTTTTRRGFVEKAVVGAATTFSIASGVVVGVPEPVSAFAGTSDKVYQPAPNSLADKVIIITGSSTGLGLESAKRLAAAGATTVLATRTESKGNKAVAQVQSYLQEQSIDNPNIFFVTLDLESLDSVRSFPQQFQDKLGNNETKIDVLMNNAGVAAIPERELTKDGFERTFQVNHLGPFLLTSLLFPLLNSQNGARVINVSSAAHQFNYNKRDELDMDNLNSEVYYHGQGLESAYSRTKLENILFAQELQRRADRKGMEWLAVSSLHPGVVATDIWRTSTFHKVDNSNNLLQSLISRFFYTVICLTPPEGANTQVWLASQVSDPTIGRGQYYDENGKIPKLADFAKDRVSARKLWERSEELLGIQFQL